MEIEKTLKAINKSYNNGIEAERERILKLIDKKIEWQEELIKQAKGKDEIINVCECIILVLLGLKKEIEGEK